MNIFWTADIHAGHWRICEYCQRPFKSLIEMDEVLFRNINSRIKEDDYLYHIGDFCFSKSKEAPDSQRHAFEYYRNLIKCKNVIFLTGNHDRHGNAKTFILSCQITFGGKIINMTHNPLNANPNYSINLVGHVHQQWKIRTFKQYYDIMEQICKQDNIRDRSSIECFLDKNQCYRNSDSMLYNVGVDVHNFRPVNYSEIISSIIKYKKGLTST